MTASAWILTGFSGFALALFMWAGRKAAKEDFAGKAVARLIVAFGILFIVLLAVVGDEIGAGDGVQIVLLLALVMVTGFYAWSAHRQADASVKMFEITVKSVSEAIRPVLNLSVAPTGKVVTSETAEGVIHGMTLSLKNIGRGPAFHVEIDTSNVNAGRQMSLKWATRLSLALVTAMNHSSRKT